MAPLFGDGIVAVRMRIVPAWRVALLCLAAATLGAGDVGATGLARKHGLPTDQANDVLGVEPGMSLIEIRKILATQFPAAFAGCSHLLESANRLLCRITATAYYEEYPGRPLNRAAQGKEGDYVSNLVLSVEEDGTKRSVEVFFGAGASGGEAYRITGTTRYSINAQPEMSDYRREFVERYGPLLAGQTRGPGNVLRAVFANGARMTGGAPEDTTLDCVDMAQAATSAHDVRAMGSHGVARHFAQPPCDTLIGLAMAPGLTSGSLSAVTVVVFDAARMAKVYQLEAAAVATKLQAAGPQRR